MNAEQHKVRSIAPIGASIAVHLAIFALVIHFVVPMQKPHDDLIVAYLVGGGSGAPGTSAAHPASPPAAPIRHVRAAPKPPIPSPSHRRPADDPPDAEVASLAPMVPSISAKPSEAPMGSYPGSSAGNGTGGDGGKSTGTGAGDTIGDGGGDGVAQPRYDVNPFPPYPSSARRRAEQGTVILRALVGVDGAVERVEIAESSGYRSLDDAAAETVRTRWKFIPARSAGTPVESWVLAPIRFALTEDRAAR